jgi:putative spermidine/putrescine transport system substrate-binding protein
MRNRAISRRGMLQGAAALGMASAVPAFGGPGRGVAFAQEGDWAAAVDMEKAKAGAAHLYTYGMPGDWANYGEVYKAFQESLGITDGQHTDTDMSSLEEITKFDAEKSNPVAMFADIGMTFGAVATEREVVPSYLPPLAADLPEGYKGATGGWVATYAGVPALVVNTAAAPSIPTSWQDLLAPEWTGKLGSPGDPRSSGTAQTTFIAWSYANGGDSENMEPGVEFAKKIIAQYNSADSSIDLMEKGEIAAWIRYDFNCAAAVNALKEKGIEAQVVIPGVSIYAPSALMLNKYKTDTMDTAKAFAEFVLGDEAAAAFARFGARPIRYVLGKQELPDDVKTNWLPEEQYKDVVVVENFTALNAEDIATLWDDEVLGG